ncbi:MAG: hypothetical protein WCB98_02745 [Candidatus Aquirickettsiella gammari]
MREILWISLPEQESVDIKGVINYINKKNLPSLSVEQLLEKLINNQADGWSQVITQYNNISSVRNIDASEMRVRALAVNNQFLQHQAVLVDKVFNPNQLLGLIILCYSNPLLIGPKLCRALKEEDADSVAREILENSAFVRAAGRVVPWASNLRLLNYALYANNTSVQLPIGVLTRIRMDAVKKGIHLVELGRLADTSDTSLAAMIPLATPPLAMVNDTNFQELQQGEVKSAGYLGVTFEESTFNFNVADHRRIDGVLASTLFLLQIPVVSPVIRNVGRDLANGLSRVAHYTGNFFMKNAEKVNASAEEQATLLSHPEVKL